VTSPNGTQAVDRAAQLLRRVVHCGDPVTFTELTAATGLAKSTTSRLMMALERGGLVRRDGAGRFLPGEMFVSYAWRGGAQASLVEVAQPFLYQVGEDTGETVNLGVASGGKVEQIAQVDSRYLIGGTNWVGLSVPLHCAALGKVLLAFGAAKLPAGRLEQRTERTITSRGALAADLSAVRSRGYAVTDEELEPGLVAVAAPVYRDGAAVVAALSVSGPASRLTSDQIPQVAARCMAGASALSAVLGHAPAEPRARTRKQARPEPRQQIQTRKQPRQQIQTRPQREGAA
jgi:IclR family transcriptional regulator, acetate operon repressor